MSTWTAEQKAAWNVLHPEQMIVEEAHTVQVTAGVLRRAWQHAVDVAAELTNKQKSESYVPFVIAGLAGLLVLALACVVAYWLQRIVVGHVSEAWPLLGREASSTSPDTGPHGSHRRRQGRGPRGSEEHDIEL